MSSLEDTYFMEIRERLFELNEQVSPGRMMRSEAIAYQGKVFAFLSPKKKMVFKLGRDFQPDSPAMDMRVFNPFKHKPPMAGWFEVPISEKKHWLPLAKQALHLIQSQA